MHRFRIFGCGLGLALRADAWQLVLHPKYTVDEIKDLDTRMRYSRGLDGTEFIPGTIGLNNVRKTDYINVVLQALAKVSSLRDFFLSSEFTNAYQSTLVNRFGQLLRKVEHRGPQWG